MNGSLRFQHLHQRTGVLEYAYQSPFIRQGPSPERVGPSLSGEGEANDTHTRVGELIGIDGSESAAEEEVDAPANRAIPYYSTSRDHLSLRIYRRRGMEFPICILHLFSCWAGRAAADSCTRVLLFVSAFCSPTGVRLLLPFSSPLFKGNKRRTNDGCARANTRTGVRVSKIYLIENKNTLRFIFAVYSPRAVFAYSSWRFTQVVRARYSASSIASIAAMLSPKVSDKKRLFFPPSYRCRRQCPTPCGSPASRA
jgi:hypothetical protein